MSADGSGKDKNVLIWMLSICRLIYWCGFGDYWYDPSNRSAKQRAGYALFSFLLNGLVFAIIFSEIAALFKTSLSESDRNDGTLFSIAHTFIIFKWLHFIIMKPKIKELLKKLLVTTQKMYSVKQVDEAQIRKSKRYCLVLAISMYAAVFSGVIDAILQYCSTGMPWRTLVTFYPENTDDSWLAYSARIIVLIYWVQLINAMLATDFLAVNCLILLSFKFKTLQMYFKNLKVEFLANPLNKSEKELENDMLKGFLKGIQLHTEILWCARRTQKSLGNVYSFQIVQSMAVLIICLIKLVMNGRNLSFLFATVCIYVCVLVLTGVYMWSAGEITHEASQVSCAMFHSGWHLCSARVGMRKLLVVGIMRSQVPVVMTGFGVVDLSYVNFIKIVKNSYSIFAVLY